MSMLFAYMAGREVGLGVSGFKMFCQSGSEFFLLALCVCGGGGGGGRGGLGRVRFSTSLSVKKIRPPPPYL